MTKLLLGTDSSGSPFCSLSIVLSAISDGQYIPGKQFYGCPGPGHKFRRYSLLKGDLGAARILEVFCSVVPLSGKFRGDPENLAGDALIRFLPCDKPLMYCFRARSDRWANAP